MDPLAISAYVQMGRVRPPVTGVGKHIINGVLGLAARDDFQVTVLTSRHELDAQGNIDDRSPLHVLPARGLPLPTLALERLWKVAGRPYADRWCDGDPWLYCTAEAYIPLRHTRQVMSVNDIHAFEEDLPWSDTPGHLQFRRRWAAWFPKAAAKADIITTISEFTKARMVKLLDIPAEKIKVVYCGAEDAFYRVAERPEDQLPALVEGPYLLVIGGLTQRKGGRHTIALAEALAAQRSPLRIVVVGRSDPDLAQRAARISHLEELGVLEDEHMPPLVRRATALLFLSRYEGFGIPAIEAMAAGTPAIVSHHASLPEIVGEAGLVVDPEDVDAVAATAERLRQEPEWRAQRAEAGRLHAQQFTWPRYVDRLAAVFNTAGGS